ncbi:MAG: division/cell wall cluster transcriptional repressor MraZ [Candidatus Phaeomarinobacter sp.]
MALFVSTYENKVDKKGRVSVPAAFRKALEGEAFDGIFCFESLSKPCIQSGGQSYIEMLQSAIEQVFDPLTDDQDDFATTLLSGSTPLALDGDGRVTLTKDLIKTGGFGETIVFVGMGDSFEIWEPNAFAEHKARARKRAAEKRALLLRPRAAAGSFDKGGAS